MSTAASTTIGFLAPMPSELRPLVRQLRLARPGRGPTAWHTGRLGAASVVASTTGIGTRRAVRATEALLEAHRVDHVVVVGVAGGLARHVAVGEVVVPEVVADAEGREFRPAPIDGEPGAGRLLTTDDFIKDRARLEALVEQGFSAIDMETAAIAKTCEDAGIPWSAYRGISDDAFDPAVGDDVLALARPDGSPDPLKAARYVLARPSRARLLARLARDLSAATSGAAQAAVAACLRAQER